MSSKKLHHDVTLKLKDKDFTEYCYMPGNVMKTGKLAKSAKC